MTIYRGTGSSTQGSGISLDDAYVNLSGDTMTGPLSVPAGATGTQAPQRGEIDTALALKANLVSPIFTGTVGGITGAMVGNTAAGNISATTVQAAINELDTEKLGKTSSTGSAQLPVGTTAERDGTPTDGYLRLNSTLAALEAWYSSAWNTLVTTASAVLTTGAQTIAGVKTFSSPVGVATAVGAGDAMRKDQTETALALKSDVSTTGMVLLATATASNSATIDFTNIQNSVYDSYLIVMDRVWGATFAQILIMRVSFGGVWQSTVGQYTHANFRFTNSGSGIDGSTSDSNFNVSGSAELLGNTSAGAFSGWLQISNCLQTTADCHVVGQYSVLASSASRIVGFNGGAIASGTARDGFRFLMSSGNIASGTFKLYGIRG